MTAELHSDASELARTGRKWPGPGRGIRFSRQARARAEPQSPPPRRAALAELERRAGPEPAPHVMRNGARLSVRARAILAEMDSNGALRLPAKPRESEPGLVQVDRCRLDCAAGAGRPRRACWSLQTLRPLQALGPLRPRHSLSAWTPRRPLGTGRPSRTGWARRAGRAHGAQATLFCQSRRRAKRGTDHRHRGQQGQSRRPSRPWGRSRAIYRCWFAPRSLGPVRPEECSGPAGRLRRDPRCYSRFHTDRSCARRSTVRIRRAHTRISTQRNWVQSSGIRCRSRNVDDLSRSACIRPRLRRRCLLRCRDLPRVLPACRAVGRPEHNPPDISR